MGTNYYRILTHEEVEQRKMWLLKKIESLPTTPADISANFAESMEDSWESYSPWDTFIKDMCIHLGKRSWGWRFCWNFNDNKFYANKEELLSYIRSGRVVDEYGVEQPVEEFIEMALSWCTDGLIGNEEYHRNKQAKNSSHWFSESFFDIEIDGLRVSSSTEFC